MISLIATVLNEGESIHRLMQSLMEQTRQPDDIVIVDGGSDDNTVALIEAYADRLPVRVIIEPGCNISAGRNRAIAAARYDIIATTDAGVRLDSRWLETITQPLLDNPDIQVVSGFFLPDTYTPFEVAMGATVLPQVDEINPDTFLPSSRSIAFRKNAAQGIGGYPEWLDYCEDLIFDLRLKATTPPFVFTSQAIAYFQPRRSLRAFYKQYYLYARGDGKANLWRKRHLIRYITYLVAAPVILLLGWIIHPLVWLFYIPGAVVYLARPYLRLPHVLADSHCPPTFQTKLLAAIYIPMIRVVGDIAKMLGYPVGVYWRWRNRPPVWHITPSITEKQS